MQFRDLFDLLKTAHDEAVLILGEEAAGSAEITFRAGTAVYTVERVEVLKKFWPNEDDDDEVEIWIRGQ